jgi:plastocyanin
LRKLWYLLILVPLALAACASAPLTRAEAAGGGTLAMKAGNFFFDPNMVTVAGTGTLTLTITNTTGSGHSIVVKDPGGKIIDSADLPPHAVVTTQVTFPAPGDYYFYCSHPFHESLGMKGHFIVSGS